MENVENLRNALTEMTVAFNAMEIAIKNVSEEINGFTAAIREYISQIKHSLGEQDDEAE